MIRAAVGRARAATIGVFTACFLLFTGDVLIAARWFNDSMNEAAQRMLADASFRHEEEKAAWTAAITLLDDKFDTFARYMMPKGLFFLQDVSIKTFNSGDVQWRGARSATVTGYITSYDIPGDRWFRWTEDVIKTDADEWTNRGVAPTFSEHHGSGRDWLVRSIRNRR